MPFHARRHRTRRRLLALVAAGLAAGTAAAVPATADVGQGLPTGGLELPGPPTVASATCAGQPPWTCARGQVLTLQGDNLSSIRAVLFGGRTGRRKGVRVRIAARAAQAGRVVVVVPRTARSGPLRLVSALAGTIASPQRLRIVRQIPGIDDAAGQAPLLAGGQRHASFAYHATGPAPEGAAVEAFRPADGAVVRSWPLAPGPDGNGVVDWDGTVDGMPAPTGSYALRLNAVADTIADPLPGAGVPFDLIEAHFPIRGAHRIGTTAMQRYGGPRGHQGQDTFAACGTPLDAAMGGTVHMAGFQGAAGNYVVVDLADGRSTTYMHLRDTPLVRTGDHVFAGQRLGYVGQTGHADGCHLHFELWTAPGWYRGGSPVDPVDALRRWDAWS